VSEAGAQQDCLFCRMASGAIDVPKLLDNDDLFVIRDINPRAPVHLLVIPKRHIPTALDVAEADGPLLARLFAAAGEAGASAGLAESGCRIAFNVGRDAGMTVWHLHMHVLGGRPLGPEG
jgi:histidine triad (HIT) family protein